MWPMMTKFWYRKNCRPGEPVHVDFVFDNVIIAGYRGGRPSTIAVSKPTLEYWEVDQGDLLPVVFDIADGAFGYSLVGDEVVASFRALNAYRNGLTWPVIPGRHEAGVERPIQVAKRRATRPTQGMVLSEDETSDGDDRDSEEVISRRPAQVSPSLLSFARQSYEFCH